MLQAIRAGSPDQLQNIWNRLPGALLYDAAFIRLYAGQLLAHARHEEAESLLREALERRWDDGLVYLYGQVEIPQPQKMLVVAEHWLKDHAMSAALLLTLGRICIRTRLWGKARAYLEAAQGLEPDWADIYRELGNLHELTGDAVDALAYYRKGLLVTPPAALQQPL